MHGINLIRKKRIIALLLSFFMILTTVISGTFAQLITKTPSLINTFLSGLGTSGDLIIRKEISHLFGDGYVIPDGLEFEFTVNLGENYKSKTVETSLGEMTADDNGTVMIKLAPDEAVCIEELTEGTYVTITEDGKTGFTPEGGAQKSLTVHAGDNPITYTNIYEPAAVNPVNVTVTGTKQLDGRDWQEGDSFTFLLEYKLMNGNQDWQELGTAVVSYDAENSDFNQFDFSAQVQNAAYDTAGTYAFRIVETGGTVSGFTYGRICGYFDVLVGDQDMDGSLEIQDVKGYQETIATYDDTAKIYQVDVPVCNKYIPAVAAQATLQIQKSVVSNSGEEKSFAGYTFELYDEGNNPVAVSSETSAAGETDIVLTYDADDAGKTFHYTMKETHAGETVKGLTFDDTVYSISVSIVENGDQTISAYVYDTSCYQTQVLTIEQETVSGNDIGNVSGNDIENASGDDSDIPSEEEESGTVSGNTVGEGSENSPGKETGEEIPKTVSGNDWETPPEAPEGESDESDTVEILPEPVALAELPPLNQPSGPETREIAVIPEGAGNTYSVSFVNQYDPADVKISFGGCKELTGRNLKDGEFAFELYEAGDSFQIPEGLQPVQSATNVGQNFTFAAINYDRIGTYRYVVKEDDSAGMGGIIYDDSVFHVAVTVTDENGTLKAEYKVTDNLGKDTEIKFRNSYRAAPVLVSFTGSKTLTGMELQADKFRFLLYQTDNDYNIQGASLAGTSNNAAGEFAFEQISFSVPGNYYYVMKEDTSAQETGMTYDDTVYGIQINVWDDEKGSLMASSAITELGVGSVDKILFENSYTESVEPPEPPGPPGPVDPSDPDEPPDTPDQPEQTDPPENVGPSEPSDAVTIPGTGTDSETSIPAVMPEETDPEKQEESMRPDGSKTPDTGDNSSIGLYVVLIVLCGFVVSLLLLFGSGKGSRRHGKRKKRKDKRRKRMTGLN